jgi:hypothetical protein
VRPQRPSIGAEDDAERGALFLRADRLEGLADRRVSAEGRVELRTHRETVLADRIAYDLVRDEVHATGNVVLRKGSDWIIGPEVVYHRPTQSGVFDSPTFQIGDSGARGDASKIVFAGADRYEVTDGRYTTCVAPRDDWYLETRALELDTGRQVGTARDATVRFFGAPIFYSPWVDFPLSNERKSGFLVPTAGSSGARGVELALPYYFNLALNYDATVTRFEQRGCRSAGSSATCSAATFRRTAAKPTSSTCPTTGRPGRTATRSCGGTSSSSACRGWAPTSTSTRSRTTSTSPTSPTASRSPRRPRCRARRASPT